METSEALNRRRNERIFQLDKYPPKQTIDDIIKQAIQVSPIKNGIFHFTVDIFGPEYKVDKERLCNLSYTGLNDFSQHMHLLENREQQKLEPYQLKPEEFSTIQIDPDSKLDDNVVKSLIESIKQDGYNIKYPISLDHNLMILDGHHRLEAAKRLNQSVYITVGVNDALKKKEERTKILREGKEDPFFIKINHMREFQVKRDECSAFNMQLMAPYLLKFEKSADPRSGVMGEEEGVEFDDDYDEGVNAGCLAATICTIANSMKIDASFCNCYEMNPHYTNRITTTIPKEDILFFLGLGYFKSRIKKVEQARRHKEINGRKPYHIGVWK